MRMPARTLLVCVIALGMSAGSCGRNSVKQVPAAAPASFVPFQTCGETGTFRGRTIEVERTTRAFLLHVPPSFSCGVAMPLLVDFHGTTSLEFPEEDLLTEETIELANSRGFVLVRPRSLAGPVDGDELFQWDVNDGDLERNRRFVHDLVALVRSEYTVDPLRTYAFGFSNGTNMATLFLGDAASPFHGYAVVGGGAWAETHVLPRSATQPRLYATTGYRDYMYEWHTTLVEKWREAGHEAEALLVRPHHGGHEVYDWQVAEAWDWLDQGRRTDRGHLFPHWVMLPFDASEDLLAVTTGPTGLLVAGANGFLAREENGAWVYPIASDPATKPITDLCLRADGTGIAVGDNRYAYTRDGGRSWTRVPGDALPDPIEGEAVAVNADGQLVVRTADGLEHRVSAGDVLHVR